jgi:hypothetical protein
MSEESCATCKFFFIKPEWNGGLCRRYPPAASIYVSGDSSEIKSASYSHFPEVDESAWCGEYKKKEEEK